MKNLTELRKAILKNKDITPEQLYDLGTWFMYLSVLKANKKAKKKKK